MLKSWIKSVAPHLAGALALLLPFHSSRDSFFAASWSLHGLLTPFSLAYLLFAGLALTRIDKKKPFLGAALSGLFLLGWLAYFFTTDFPKNHIIGPGGFLSLLYLLFILSQSLTYSGWVRGDIFVVLSIVLNYVLIVIFTVYPVYMVLARAVFDSHGAFHPSMMFEALQGFTQFFRVLKNSLILAVIVSAICPLVGLAYALLTIRSRFGFNRYLKFFSMLPIITPPFIIGLSIIMLFGLQGAISSGLLGLQTRGIFGLPGLVLAQVLSFSPVAYLILSNSVESIRPTLEEASLTLGANRWTTFRRITWPLLKPGLANAFLLTFVESLSDFGNPMILGGDYEVLATEIYFSIIGRFDQTLAASLSVVLLCFTLSAFFIQYLWIGKKSYVTVTGKPSSAFFLPLPKILDYSLTVFCVFWALITLVIYASVPVGSFVKLWGINHEFTFKHYQMFMFEGYDTLKKTLLLAAIAAPITSVIGLSLAYCLSRYAFAGRKVLEFLSMISFAVPGTVVGIGYILAFNKSPLFLTGTAGIIVISYVFRNISVGMRSGMSALSQIDRSLEEASVTLGANFFKTFRKILMPLIRQALVSSIVYSFVRSITTISAVVFLVSPEWQVCMKLILDHAEAGKIGQATAGSTILMLIMILMIFLSEKVIYKIFPGVKLEGLKS